MRLLIIYIITVCTLFNSHAQNGAIVKLEALLNEQSNIFPKSKTFVKTDKDVYAPGEKVWFKAEVMNVLTQALSQETQMVVMIKAESGEVIVDNKYLIHSGIVANQITIPAWANEGDYYLIAYTPNTMMANEASLSGIKPITINALKRNDFIIEAALDKKIYKPGDEMRLTVNLNAITPSGKKERIAISMFDYYKEIYSQKVNVPVNEPIFFKFRLPSEIENGINFVIETNGKSNFSTRIPVYTTKDQLKMEFFIEGGNLLTNNTQRIVYRAVDPFGRTADVTGLIYDEAGNQAGKGKMLKNGVGLINFVPLPNHVYTFKINSEYGKGQQFELPEAKVNGSAFTIVKTEEAAIRVAVLNNGNMVGKKLILVAVVKGIIKRTFDFVAEQKNFFTITNQELPLGIVNFVVMDQSGKIVSERLIYNIPNKDTDIRISSVIAPTAKKGEYELEIDINGFIDQIGAGSYDLKIVDSENLYNNKAPFRYNYLEYPLATPTPLNILDLFITNIELIANRYRYYSLHDLLSGIDYGLKPEGKSLSGYVTDKNGFRIPNATVMATHPNNLSMATTQTDAGGRFVFGDIAKSCDMVVKAINETGKKNYIVHLFRSFDESLEELLLIESFNNYQSYNSAITPAYFQQNENLLKLAGSETKDRKPRPASNTEKMLQSGASLLDVIRIIKPYSIKDNQVVFYGSTNSIYHQQGALIVIDGQKMGTSISALDMVNPFDVVSVNISTNPTDIQEYTALNTVGIIEIRTRGGFVSGQLENIEEQEKHFSNFSDLNLPQNIWKYQSTIYWEPNAVVDERGKIIRRFNISDLKSDFIIQVDLKSIDGVTFQHTKTFSTKH